MDLPKDLKELKESNNYLIDSKGFIYSKLTNKKLKSNTFSVNLKLEDSGYNCFSRKNVIANNLIPNPNNYKKVIHIDGNSNNFNPKNIKWAETFYGKAVFNKDKDKEVRNKICIMICKCHKKTDKGYKYYGAKGIRVYDKWKSNTIEFVKWSKENGYYEGAFLLRYDKNKNFSPDNCYWGNDVPNMKLNCDMFQDIRERLENTTAKIIANKYQVSSERIHQIKRGATLKDC